MNSAEPPPEPAAETPLRCRWVRDTRYYEVHVEQDLWGDWVLTRVWGRRGTALGRIRRDACASRADALEKLAAMERQRARRGYVAVAGWDSPPGGPPATESVDR